MDVDPDHIADMDWATLYDRAGEAEIDADVVRAVLARQREQVEEREGRCEEGSEESREEGRERMVGSETQAERGVTGEGDDTTETLPKPSPARVVADADVLAADLLVGDPSREALEGIWRHSWITLLASDRLLADAEATIAELSTPELAADWRGIIEDWREPVAHPAGDHPGLASAYRGGAMHLLSFDRVLSSSRVGAELRGRVPLSVREPRAFATVFDAESLYLEVVGGEFPGPDRPSRA